MNQRTILVTGATDGIGKQTALELCQRGARVIVHGRHPGRVAATVGEIQRAVPEGAVESAVGDLASLAAVRNLGADLLARFDALHVLVNNAGVFAQKRTVTPDGFETTFAVNHLAHYLLTRLLLPRIEASGPGARIVNVSSMAHTRGRMNWDDLQYKRRFDGYAAYAQSKLANVLFSMALAKRLDATRVAANALHPGVIQTKLLREGFGMSGGGDLREGAATSVYLATSDAVKGATGRYYASCREVAHAGDDESAEKLWAVSAQLCGLEP